MNSKIEKAVILAAGMGTRLDKKICGAPKGFIQLGDKSIIEESIEKLLSFSIEEIIIVTGYLSSFYEELAQKYRCIRIVKNEKYSNSGSMYSLYCARDLIKKDFLLLESDLIYETGAIKELLNCPESDVILISGYTNAGDEVFVETKDSKLVNMSKDKAELKNIAGELVGISKVSLRLYKEMIRQSEEKFKNTLLLDYEIDGFVFSSSKKDIYCHKVEDLIWCEVDDHRQYCNAREMVYPRILNMDKKEK